VSLRSIALHPHAHPKRAVFSPDGSRFFVVDDNRFTIYDRDGVELATAPLVQHGRVKPAVFGLAWSPDDAYIATAENDALRLRALDLSIVAESKIGRGPAAFCANGTRLAVASHSNLHVLEVPTLADLGSLGLEWGSYDSFDITEVVADPTGTFIAATDYGGWSEDEWGHTADRGIPKVTIVDATAPTVAVHSLTQPQPTTDLEFDRWRRRIVIGNYAKIVVRDLDGHFVTEWSPYNRVTVKAIGVCELYVATMPDFINARIEPSIDLWDPVTYKHQRRIPFLAGVERDPIIRTRPWWLTPSPDGSRLVAHEPDGVRIFAVE
jgi:WD40 repeat protein